MQRKSPISAKRPGAYRSAYNWIFHLEALSLYEYLNGSLTGNLKRPDISVKGQTKLDMGCGILKISGLFQNVWPSQDTRKRAV